MPHDARAIAWIVTWIAFVSAVFAVLHGIRARHAVRDGSADQVRFTRNAIAATLLCLICFVCAAVITLWPIE